MLPHQPGPREVLVPKVCVGTKHNMLRGFTKYFVMKQKRLIVNPKHPRPQALAHTHIHTHTQQLCAAADPRVVQVLGW